MEKREKQTVVSCQERREALYKLADCLSSSEWVTWIKEMEKLDKLHKEQAYAWYAHYMMERRGQMQKGWDPLYSKCKQSLYNQWVKDLDKMHWID